MYFTDKRFKIILVLIDMQDVVWGERKASRRI